MSLPRSSRPWTRAERFVFLCPLLLLVLAGVGVWIRQLSSQKLLYVAFSPDGNILCAYSNARLVVRDGHSGRDLKTLVQAHPVQSIGFALSPDGRTILTPGNGSNEVTLRDAHTGFIKSTLTSPSATTYLSFSPDGSLAAVHNRSSNWFFDSRTGTKRNALQETTGNCVLALRDQNTAVAAFNSGTGVQLGVRNTASGKWLKLWHNGGIPIHALALSNDKRVVAAASHQPYAGQSQSPIGITLYDARTGAVRHALQPFGDFGRLTFSPDGTRLAASLDGTRRVTVWSVATGQELFSVEHPSAFNFTRSLCLSWSPDGNTLLTGSSNDQLCLWDGHTGREKPFSS